MSTDNETSVLQDLLYPVNTIQPVVKHPTGCQRYRLNVCIHDTGCQTGCTTWFDNRVAVRSTGCQTRYNQLYRVNGALLRCAVFKEQLKQKITDFQQPQLCLSMTIITGMKCKLYRKTHYNKSLKQQRDVLTNVCWQTYWFTDQDFLHTKVLFSRTAAYNSRPFQVFSRHLNFKD